MSLKELPWEWYRDIFFKVKKFLFLRKGYSKDIVLPNTSVQELKIKLREQGYISGEYLSYEYKGEDLNIVKPQYRDDNIEWYQVHLRAFEVRPDKGTVSTELDVHFEPDPREDNLSKPHLKQINHNIEDPVKIVKEDLKEVDINYHG